MKEARYAVLVPMVETGQGTGLLLEVRTEYVKQPGEICFPGGKIEEDETPVTAALRETCEELGISAGDVEIVKELDRDTLGKDFVP